MKTFTKWHRWDYMLWHRQKCLNTPQVGSMADVQYLHFPSHLAAQKMGVAPSARESLTLARASSRHCRTWLNFRAFLEAFGKGQKNHNCCHCYFKDCCRTWWIVKPTPKVFSTFGTSIASKLRSKEMACQKIGYERVAGIGIGKKWRSMIVEEYAPLGKWTTIKWKRYKNIVMYDPYIIYPFTYHVRTLFHYKND